MIEKSFAFISGLPRSGSTLLCNILAQNPEAKVSKATSGLHDVLFGVRNQWDRLTEHQAEGVDPARLKRVLQGIFHILKFSLLLLRAIARKNVFQPPTNSKIEK